MKTLKILAFVILILVLVPIASWLIWNVKPSQQLDIMIVNKTVLHPERWEQRGLFWLLINSKFVKSDKKAYNLNQDYYGFYPLKPLKSRKYEVKRIKLTEIDNLSSSFDMTYYVDAYGVFFNEWYRGQGEPDKGTLIEGGLTNNDYLFLKKMHDEGKLIIAEYNFLAPPTIGLVRKKTEDLLGIHWSNWIGKYVNNLNPEKSKDLPVWVVDMYKKRNNGKWPYNGEGIIYVNEPAKLVVVLENGTHLDKAVPDIQTTGKGDEMYQLPEAVHYSNWFDIVENGDNDVIADFKIHINLEGKSLLEKHNLPSRFPAVIKSASGAPFYYFAGNFASYPIDMWTAKLQGVRTLEKLFYNNKPASNSKFYWTYYVPLISEILHEYQESL